MFFCNPAIDDIKSFIAHNLHSSSIPEFYGNVSGLCNEVKTCLHPFDCKEAVAVRDAIERGCDLHLFMIQENRDCFRRFLRNIYSSYSTNITSCVRQYDYLEKNLEDRYHAYVEGKECFLNFVDENCSEISRDFYSSRFMNIAKAISTKPGGQNCHDLPHTIEAEQCLALYDLLKEQTNKATSDKLMLLFGLVGLSEEFDICKETQKCIKNNCYFNSEPIRKIVDGICDRLSQHV